MNIIISKPSVTILRQVPYQDTLNLIETAGRLCYNSASPLTLESGERFARTLIKNGHESVLEHISITFLLSCSRNTSHQLVRHRIASYTQNSQRYINYSKQDTLEVICPAKIMDNPEALSIWTDTVDLCYQNYKILIGIGIDKEDSRSLLSPSTKTEVVTTMNLRSLRHFLKLRTDKHAQSEIRYLATSLLNQLKDSYPAIFEDL